MIPARKFRYYATIGGMEIHPAVERISDESAFRIKEREPVSSQELSMPSTRMSGTTNRRKRHASRARSWWRAGHAALDESLSPSYNRAPFNQEGP